jgi:hypothetical protein
MRKMYAATITTGPWLSPVNLWNGAFPLFVLPELDILSVYTAGIWRNIRRPTKYSKNRLAQKLLRLWQGKPW